ncbi:hypothetical protein [Psychromonas sp. Urea-02u-13]|uniref:hypothetical protein n=1 Tax=Psychromonas sp. Urea-02u-13 TaxID=2058326 RepID=UPI000C34A641|nr:hypothetical protein [Psychromonas sp. Urea-02u-13]PKG39226.1 hypothetical protein CXF74_09305 [Psychromonas sp. Urea-02u-13]
MDNTQQIKPIVLEKNISASNLLLLHALLTHSGLLILDCYQLIMLNTHYLVMTANKSLKRQAQRKHCKNWLK